MSVKKMMTVTTVFFICTYNNFQHIKRKMAHAYTTKRGKNKMSKLGVRKDQQQNSERSLKANPLANLLFDGPKESILSPAGRIGTSSRLEDTKARLQRALLDKCSYSDCPNATQTSSLSECSSCHQTRYCSKDCQVKHWDSHKEQCKIVRKQLKAQEKEKEEKISAALKELNLIDQSNDLVVEINSSVDHICDQEQSKGDS